jgi:hypothetical protein
VTQKDSARPVGELLGVLPRHSSRNNYLSMEEAGAKGLLPLSPAPQIPAQPKPSLRSGHFQLTMPNTSCTIITLASLRSECCSPLFRNAVRLPSGIDVHLHRNAHD